MLTAWRIVPEPRSSTAFDGEGARLYGGHWNHKGTSLVYCSESLSLAALEQLVHLGSSMFLREYRCFQVQIEDSFCQVLAPENLPPDWFTYPAPLSTRNLGSAWAKSRASAVLAVPSVIVPSEKNYLLNPNHPDFKRISIGAPQDFSFDPRLLKKTR